jgi:hypothetical protein
MRKLTILAKQRLIGEIYKDTKRAIVKETWRQYGDTLFSLSYHVLVPRGGWI